MKCIRHFASFAAVCLLAMSCTHDPGMSGGSGKTPGDDHSQVRFVIKAPAPVIPGTRLADPAFENSINNITVFLLKTVDDEFILSGIEMIEDFQSVGGNAMAFTMSLEVSETPTKLLFATNLLSSWTDMFNDPSYVEGIVSQQLPEEQVRTGLISPLSLATKGSADGMMVMSGDATLPTIDPNTTVNIEVPLIRAVARVDLQINLDADSKSFEPVNAAVYRAQNSFSSFPSEEALDPSDHSRVIAATVPTPATGLPYQFTLDPVDPATGLFATTYVSENVPPTTADGRLNEATCVVVGGYFNESSEITYYRVDFNSGEAGHPFGQILRNHKYIFDITKVTAPGFTTPDEAAVSVSNSMTIDVTTWDENVSQVNFVGTGDYAWLSTNSVELPYNQGSQQTFAIRSTLFFDWQLGNDGPPIPSDAPIPQSDANYTVTLAVANETTTYTDYVFTVEALSDNFDPGNDRESGVIITIPYGDEEVTMGVNITQEASIGASSRKINVLSITDEIGTMGVLLDNELPADDSELRELLTNESYFGPGGVVDFGGFTFDVFETGTIIATTSVSLEKFQRALLGADILVAPYNTNPPQGMVDLILEWLEDPRHVLFISCDTESSSNILLRQSLDDGLTWYPVSELGDENTILGLVGNLLGGAIKALIDLLESLGLPLASTVDTTVNGLMMADPGGTNLPFIQGPFGLADQTQRAHGSGLSGDYYSWDAIAQWAVPATNSPVIPLAVFEVTVSDPGVFLVRDPTTETEKTSMMMIGVNPEDRIVYLGESQMIDTYLDVNPVTGAGTLGTPGYNSISTLLCNIWAWAANTVMSE